MLLLVLIMVPVFGQQRSAKDIENLFKGVSDVEAILNGNKFQDGNINKTIILSEATPNLNDIENKLLDDYEQVVLMCNAKSKPFYCYFVKDKENKRGVVGLDGEIIVPPLSGNICNINNGGDFGILLVGELSRPLASDFFQDFVKLSNTKEYGILGLFSAVVVNADKPSIKNLLPLDQYVFLSLGSRGNLKFDIFTMKIIDDDPLWGIIDMKGKEILPNKYTGFIRKGHILDKQNTGMWGKWVGTTEMDMTEALNYSRDLKADSQRRRLELASTLNSVGSALIDAGQSVESIQNILSSSGGSESSSVSGGSGNLEVMYNKWASRAEQNYNSLTKLGLRGKKDGKDAGGTTGQGMSSSNYVQMKKLLREAQNEMKSIRQKANKQGIKIKKSEYEDIQVKY